MTLVRRLPWVVSATETDWDALYAEYLPRIYNFFRYRVGDGAEAEDLTSLTFQKAWSARERYRRDLSAFATWLFTIARHVAIDHLRQRRQQVPLEAIEHLASGDSPEDDAAHRSDMARLTRLLLRLEPDERELLALKYGAGLTNRAIARSTGLSESNVGTRLHRMVQALRADWSGDS